MKKTADFAGTGSRSEGNRTGELRLGERFHCTRIERRHPAGRSARSVIVRCRAGNGSGDRSDRSTCPPDRAGGQSQWSGPITQPVPV